MAVAGLWDQILKKKQTYQVGKCFAFNALILAPPG
jgi:hypothetical protein